MNAPRMVAQTSTRLTHIPLLLTLSPLLNLFLAYQKSACKHVSNVYASSPPSSSSSSPIFFLTDILPHFLLCHAAWCVHHACVQAHGKGRAAQLNGIYLRQCFLILACAFVFTAVTTVFAEKILLSFGQPADVAKARVPKPQLPNRQFVL